jgi:hypothetical protein
MRDGKGKGWHRGWTCRHWAKSKAARVVRHATRQLLRTLDPVVLEAIQYPAPVGGWWDMPCQVVDTRIPRALLEVNRFDADTLEIPQEPQDYPALSLDDLVDADWSMFDDAYFEDFDDWDREADFYD